MFLLFFIGDYNAVEYIHVLRVIGMGDYTNLIVKLVVVLTLTITQTNI